MRRMRSALGFTALGLWALAAGCARADVVRDEVPLVVAQKAPAPDLLTLELASVDRFVAAAAPATLEVRVRLAVAGIDAGRRAPANLALAIDTSGSMEGKSIEDARSACEAMLAALADGDRLAIVTFDSRAEVLVPSTVLDAAARADIRKRIATIRAHGTTNMKDGLQGALRELGTARDPAHINRLVVVGDGVPNDASGLLALAQQAGAQGIGITTLGLGLEYDETLMGNLAKATGGKFHFVRESADVAHVLEKEVLRLQRTVGRNASLALVTGPGVRVTEVVGYDMQPSAGGVRVAVGDLSESETRDLIVKLAVPGHAAGLAVELFDATVAYTDAVVGGGPVEKHGFIAVHASSDRAELEAGHDAAIERSAARASVASLVLAAIGAARAGNLPLAQATVDRAIGLARERGKALHDAELDDKAKELLELRATLPTLVPVPIIAAPDANGMKPLGGTFGAPSAAPPATPGQAELVRTIHAQAVQSLDGE